jgi:pyruvate dehydrogenase kinase 2/3/4
MDKMSSADVSDLINEYASREQTPISLLDLMSIHTTTSPSLGRLGQRLVHERTLMNMADLLQEELPVRLAHRIQDLDSIHMLRDMPSVQQVKSIYISSFLEILQAPQAESPQLEQEFGMLLQNLYHKHSNVLLQMARGVLEYKHQHNRSDNHSTVGHHLINEEFLNRFYMSRVGIRVLAGQYLALRHQLLHDPWGKIPSNYVGMICRETSPYDVVQSAIADATMLCKRQFGEAPQVEISGCLNLSFCYIPTHLHYILRELLKNSLRATMEFHHDPSAGNRNAKPPVTVIIANDKENEDVVLKVMDEGGGIPRSQIHHIWSYLFTTASPKIQQEFFDAFDEGSTQGGAVLAGLGYGLPLSRAYARYFGGDLDLISMEGYGTDAFCHLVRLGDKAPLPL